MLKNLSKFLKNGPQKINFRYTLIYCYSVN